MLNVPEVAEPDRSPARNMKAVPSVGAPFTRCFQLGAYGGAPGVVQ